MKEMNSWWLGFIAFFAVVFVIMEWIGWAKFGTPGTLSAHVREWSWYHPLVPFAIGALVGFLANHFWADAFAPH